jgi:hypothetical protein
LAWINVRLFDESIGEDHKTISDAYAFAIHTARINRMPIAIFVLDLAI